MEGRGNDGKGDIPERDLWETKQELFDTLNKQFEFTFDCCASEKNKKCEHWHDDFEKVGTEEAGLSEDDIAWMNPPFSNALKMFEHFFKVVDKGVAIYRCDNMTYSQINHAKAWGFSRRSLNLKPSANTENFNVTSAKKETTTNRIASQKDGDAIWLKTNIGTSIRKSIRLMLRLLWCVKVSTANTISIITSSGY